jgi:hypothetical protein
MTRELDPAAVDEVMNDYEVIYAEMAEVDDHIDSVKCGGPVRLVVEPLSVVVDERMLAALRLVGL